MPVVVVGQVARDLVLRVDGLPDSGGAAPVLQRREVLGGKGANQAVALAQLGESVALVAVAGEDPAGDDVLRQARADGIDVSGVVRRGRTALLVDLVDAPGSRRLLEDVPPESLLTPADVRAAHDLLRGADAVLLQLQQPPPALLAAASSVSAGCLLVLDGAVEDPAAREALLRRADVVRVDDVEAELLCGAAVRDLRGAAAAARELLSRGPRLVALTVPGQGDLVVWSDGEQLVPHLDHVVDQTGGGDSFVAGLTSALRRGAGPRQAAEAAATTSRSTVGRLGGRPALSPSDLPAAERGQADRHRTGG